MTLKGKVEAVGPNFGQTHICMFVPYNLEQPDEAR